ncbi:MAG: ABC transporter permease, partial [Terriglobales bacterium]
MLILGCRSRPLWWVSDPVPLLHDFSRDLKYGFRMWRKSPLVFMAVAVTLAIGIGLDAGAFAVINGLLLRPRSDHDPATFARLYAEYTQNKQVTSYGGQFSPSAYRTLQRESRGLAQLAAWRTDGVVLGDDSARTLDMEVSCNFFSVYGLGVPKFGRLFRADECGEGALANVAIVSEELWRERFGSDPQILGKTILVNRIPFTLIGITPLEFSGRLRGPGLWVPLSAQARLTTSYFSQPDLAPSLWLEGRIRPGMTRAELASELKVLARRVELPSRDLKLNILVTSGALIDDPNVRPSALWIMLAVISGPTLLLLVSCANVAVLLLSRAAVRRREIAVRLSVGASRRRVVNQLIAEILLLAMGAAAAGVCLAVQVPKTFQKMIPSMPHYAFGLDWHIAAYLIGITLFASFLAGLAPAVDCLRQDVWHTLKAGAQNWNTGQGRWSVRDLLVITQVFCSIVLMSISAIYIRAEFTILNADPGFDTRQVLQVPVQLPTDRYNAAGSQQLYDELQQRFAAIPAVEAVAYGSASPLGADPGAPGARSQFRLPTQGEIEGRAANVRMVSANYFSTLGVPILLGRAFTVTPSDSSSVVVSRSFANTFWPNQDPIEETVTGSDGQQFRVIGVARDTRTEHFGEVDGPTLYRVRTAPA